MIDSKRHKENLIKIIEDWVKHTKVEFFLRPYDIPSLVGSILEEFYHVSLCCGHLVKSMEDGVLLEFEESDGSTIQGCYCADCAEEYKKKLGARILGCDNIIT